MSLRCIGVDVGDGVICSTCRNSTCIRTCVTRLVAVAAAVVTLSRIATHVSLKVRHCLMLLQLFSASLCCADQDQYEMHHSRLWSLEFGVYSVFQYSASLPAQVSLDFLFNYL